MSKYRVKTFRLDGVEHGIIVASHEEHLHLVHPCGKTELEGFDCENCLIEQQIACMQDHTTEEALETIMRQAGEKGLSEEEALAWHHVNVEKAIRKGWLKLY